MTEKRTPFLAAAPESEGRRVVILTWCNGVIAAAAFVLGIVAVSRSSTVGVQGPTGSQGVPGSTGPAGPMGPPGKDYFSSFQSNFLIPPLGYKVEGFNYDPLSQRFLFGSIDQKGIFALEPGHTGSITTFWKNDLSVLNAGVLGVYVDVNYTSHQYNLWAAISNFPSTQPAGLLRYNMVTGEREIIDLTTLTASNTNVINDMVVVPDGSLYATNTFNGQLFKLTYDSVQKKYTPSLFYNNASFIQTDQLGFDGIEYDNGTLLVGIYCPGDLGGGLYRFNAANSQDNQKVVINGGSVDFVDGIRFTPDKSKLYVVNGKQYLTTLQSFDNWATANVLESIDLSTNPNVVLPVTAVALIPGTEMIYVLCANNFGPGPYSIVRVR